MRPNLLLLYCYQYQILLYFVTKFSYCFFHSISNVSLCEVRTGYYLECFPNRTLYKAFCGDLLSEIIMTCLLWCVFSPGWYDDSMKENISHRSKYLFWYSSSIICYKGWVPIAKLKLLVEAPPMRSLHFCCYQTKPNMLALWYEMYLTRIYMNDIQ